MAQFVLFEPESEFIGQSMISLIEAAQEDIQHVLNAYHIDEIDPDEWYPGDLYMDILKDLAGPSHNLVSIGMKIPEKATYPPLIDSLEMALLTINDAYQMDQRHGYNGSYVTQQIDDRDFVVIARNPFPCDFDYGILSSLCRRFLPPGTSFTVKHDDTCECRKDGADSCTYHITWG